MARSATVIKLPYRTARRARAPDEAPARWQGEDQVFFHKTQITVGTVLENFGRIDHASEWTVVEIKTHRLTRNHRLIVHRVQAVEKLSDDVVLRRTGANEVRQVTFAALSYSSIWRLKSA